MDLPIDPVRITNHAAERFMERIRPARNVEDAKIEIALCLVGAKPKHFRYLKRHKRTTVVPTGCCLAIFASNGALVTVLSRSSSPALTEAKDG